jgi:ribosomal protein S18 acetylase RimI-like enzyme
MVKIQSFTLEYAKQVVELSHKLFNTHECYKSVENVKMYEDSGFIALNEDNEIVGYSMFGIVHKDIPEFTIVSIGVKEDYRRQGIAKDLLSEIRNYFRKTYSLFKELFGVKYEIHLQVRRNNVSARKLYLKEKFKEIELIEDYYNQPTDDGIHMSYTFYKY